MNADEMKLIVAKNITDLRKSANMTQLELADSLNYTDKAISKWERGESIPDVLILKRIADLFSVSVDYLLSADHTAEPPPPPAASGHRRTRVIVSLLSILLVWLIATAAFVLIMMLPGDQTGAWLSFLYAVPISSVVWLVFNSLWFSEKRNYLIISVLLWSFLAAAHLTLAVFGYQFWMLYLLGIPGQIIILVWSFLHKH